MSAFGVNCELLGHEGAVRAAAQLEGGALVTGAMDSVARFWVADEGGGFSALESASVFDHEHWVTAATRLPTGGFATGSMDKRVRVFAAGGEREAVLEGHEAGVISLAVSSAGDRLLSGSWDGTARVWDLKTGQCVHVLPGHENGVCVLELPDGSLVTGSTGRQVGNTVADFQLRFWAKDSYALTKTLADHKGPIRQLALVPDIGFVSCSNDGTIKLRTLDGSVLATMEHPLNAEGKPGFVLGVAVLNDGRIVSASEDCTARVWSRDGHLLQTIEHPGGLWCVTALANGNDFVTGCDDKIARVFTEDPSRISEAAAASFQAAVDEARLVRERGPSGVEIDKLPDYDQRIQVQGSSDGQIQMFKRGSKAWACQWSGPSRTWVDIGEVTGTGGGGVVDGQAYDMVIPVEIELPGGVKKLEIGYNQGQNPFTVAQEFIDKHMLDQNYLREIADYITQRASEYRPPVLGNDEDVNFAGSTTSTSVAQPAVSQYKFFPVAVYNTFETTKISKLMTTVRQFNEKLPSYETLPAGAVLADKDLISLENVVRTVQDTAYYHSSTFHPSELRVLSRVITQWPAELVFPVLDLLRLVVVHPQGPEVLGDAVIDDLASQVLGLGLKSSTLGSEQVPIATRMLSLRVLANMFVHTKSRAAVLAHKDKILGHLVGFQNHHHKLVALSLATVLLNFSRTLIDAPGLLTANDQIVVCSLSAELLNGGYTVAELGDDTILRALIAIGTLAVAGDASVRDAAVPLVRIFVAGKASSLSSAPVVECLGELQALLGV